MQNKFNIRRVHVPRRLILREAKRWLRRVLMRCWQGSRAGLESFVRRVLWRRSRNELLAIARGPAMSALLVAAGVLGAGNAASDSIQLSDIALNDNGAGFAVHGQTAGEFSGYSVSAAGDINGDGLGDFILGAYRADTSAGKAYVVFGKTDGAALELSDIAMDANDGGFEIRGEAEGDEAGFGVSGGGDVNGDGRDDLIVGAYLASPNGDRSGTSYVIFGKADGAAVDLSDIAMDSNPAGFAMYGVGDGDNSGYAVAHGGDVNGDGLDDVIVGARRAIVDGYSRGSAYLVFGKTDGTSVELSDISMDTDAGGFAIYGAVENDRFGSSVAGIGDMNNDGLADVLVGAWGADTNGSYSGTCYVVFGKADGVAVEAANIAMDVNDGGFAIHGGAAGDRAGIDVSGAGDVNGDGVVDVVVGAWLAQPNGSSTGSAYVVFGKSDGAAVDLADIAMDLNDGGFAMNGAESGDRAGFAVARAGDFDGDGFDDVMVGTATGDVNGDRAGLSYIVYGKSNGASVELSALLSDGNLDGLAFVGAAEDDFAGNHLSDAGDINGDGSLDVLIGAFGADSNGLDAGTTYVIFAPVTGDTRWVDLSHAGTEDGSFDNPFDTFGEAIDDVPSGGTIKFKAGATDRTTPEFPTLSKPMRVESFVGKVIIGVP